MQRRYLAMSFFFGSGLLALGACASGDATSGSSADAGAMDATTPSNEPINTGTSDGAASGDRYAADAYARGAGPTIVYVGANDPTSGRNAILAYAQGANGSLTPLAGSPFLTGGSGVSNPTQALGPDDTDQELVLSADRSRLFAVNGGSNTISVFDVAADGSLTTVAGSPFPSGGIDPASIGLAGPFLYVVNQAEDPLQDAGDSGSPNYTGFRVLDGGALEPIDGSTVVAGKSPQLALTTPDGKLLFGLDFLAPLASPPAGPIRAFAIDDGGLLTAAPGTPMALPPYDGGSPPGLPAALGLALHPTLNVLYVGFVMRREVGVYTYDRATGALTYVTQAPVSGPAPCWMRANADGSRLYVVDSSDDSVSVLDVSNALAPREIQHLQLKDTGPVSDSGATASQSFELALSPDGAYLFVLSQRTTVDPRVTEGNILHVLTVGADGKLTETVPDVKLPVPITARPQGVIAR